MSRKKNRKIDDPVEYFKDVTRLRWEIANMLVKCGLNFFVSINDGVEQISTISQRIIPNGAICVELSRNFPAKIITPFGKIYIETLRFDDNYKKIIAFKELFNNTFQPEQLDDAQPSVFGTYEGPWLTIRRLPWKQNRLPNYKFDKDLSDRPNAEENIKKIYKQMNESFIKDGTPEYCVEPNFDFISSNTKI